MRQQHSLLVREAQTFLKIFRLGYRARFSHLDRLVVFVQSLYLLMVDHSDMRGGRTTGLDSDCALNLLMGLLLLWGYGMMVEMMVVACASAYRVWVMDGWRMIHKLLLGGITTATGLLVVVGVLSMRVQAVRRVVIYRSGFSVTAPVD